MQITCPECGCPYDSSRPSCPECGNPTQAAPPVAVPVARPVGIPAAQAVSTPATQATTSSNCPSCGAPIGAGTACEYCGCAYPRIIPQAPQQVIINNQPDQTTAAISGFLGGLVGGALIDW